jgi:hypothetical protein
LREVAYEFGAGLLAGREAQAHALAAETLAQHASKTLENSAKSVKAAKAAQFSATRSEDSGSFFSGGESSGSAAARAGAGYAAAHSAAKRAGANKRNGKAKTENDTARSLLVFADERIANLGAPAPVNTSGIKAQTDQTEQQITGNAETVISQGDDLQEVLSQLTEIDTRSIGDQVKKNSEDADQLIDKSGLPWWVLALAGLAVLRG